MKENLQSYMEHCQSKLGPHFFVDDIDLSLLCIKCMEVSNFFNSASYLHCTKINLTITIAG